MIPKLFTALVTPFKDLQVDFPSLEKVISQQIDCHINGLLALGSTAETPTLTHDEKGQILSLVAKYKKSPFHLMVGVGSNSTRKVMENIELAQFHHADSALVVTPYYNNPSPQGIFEHFRHIATHSSLPIVLYNHPKRTGQNIPTKVLEKLLRIENIIGLKDASANLSYIQALMSLKRQVRRDFQIFCGDDGNTLPYFSLGANGLISIASNLFPAKINTWINLLAQMDFQASIQCYYELFDFLQILGIETNPAPIKYAMKLAGMIDSDEMRPPLATLEHGNKKTIQSLTSQPLWAHGTSEQIYKQASI